MRKKTINITAIITLFIALSIGQAASALDFSPYIGGGMNYNVEEFETGSDYDNAFGYSLSLGSFITKNFAMDFQFEKILDFGTKNPITESEVDLRSYTLNFIYYPVKEPSDIRGYIRAGAGFMKIETGDHSVPKSDSDREDGFCIKLGGGCDFKVSEIITFFLAADYTEGYNDVNPVGYFSGSVGFKLFPWK